MSNSYQSYHDVGVSTEVMSASSHQLIQLMFDKCLSHIDLARNYMLSHDALKKRQSITKALDIVEYLRMCLNHKDEKSQELSSLLDSLYVYMQRNLLKANLSDDMVSLEEARKVLDNIKSGWDGIGNK